MEDINAAPPEPGISTPPIAAPLMMTREEVAAVLQVPADTVTNLHRERKLRGVRIGKHLRWRPNDLRDFVERLQGDRERA